MNFPPPLIGIDVWALGAVIALSVGAMLLLLLEFLPRDASGHRPAVVSLATLLIAGATTFVARDARRVLFGGMFVQDGVTVFFTLLFCAIGALGVLLSWDYARRLRIAHGEFYVLLLLSVLGMIVMAASNDLITVFLGLELMSLPLYVLVGIRRGNLESNEASLKYFLLGAFASGFLLYGIALLYGATGTTNLIGMATFLADAPKLDNPLLIAGVVLVLVGFGFKVSAVPFHMWTPDAYEGAPTSVTAFMSAGAKAAGFAALIRVALHLLDLAPELWSPLLAGVAVVTMTVGNVTALMQNSVKRMLAYSSVAHAGYVLVALVAGGADGASAAVFYLAVYSFMNLGAFGLLTLLGRGQDERVLLSDLAGLGFRHPWLGLAMTLFMLSLGGIPPTAGFMGKVVVFTTALQTGHVLLTVIAVLNSAVSVYYYLRVTVAMYMEQPQGEPTPVSAAIPGAVALALSAIVTLWWGIQSGGLLDHVRRSVLGIL